MQKYYDPLVYIIEHLSACLEDENLEIFADRENALKSCFSEDLIKMFYMSKSGRKIKVKLGSNIIKQQITDITENKNHKFKIEVYGKMEEFEINNTLSCAKQQSPPQKPNTPVIIVVIVCIVFGSVGSVVVVVISFSIIRRRTLKKTEETVKDKKDGDYANEDYTYYDTIQPAYSNV